MLVASRWVWTGQFIHKVVEVAFRISPAIPAGSMLIRAEFAGTANGSFASSLGVVVSGGDSADVETYGRGTSIFTDGGDQKDGQPNLQTNFGLNSRYARMGFDMAVAIHSTPARLLMRSEANAFRITMAYSFLVVPLSTIAGQPGSGVFEPGTR